jgi:hypothetical protein
MEPAQQSKARTIFVSGHLDLTPAEFQEHYVPRLREAVLDGYAFVVGDARGADVMSQQWLYLMFPPTTVFHMRDKPRNNPHKLPTRGGFETDEERDAAMTKASDDDIAWVRPGREKSGTAKNLRRRKAI